MSPIVRELTVAVYAITEITLRMACACRRGPLGAALRGRAFAQLTARDRGPRRVRALRNRAGPGTGFPAWAVAVTAVLACSEPTEPVNLAPEAVGRIPGQRVIQLDTVELDVSEYFQDPDGGELAYSAAASPGGIVALWVRRSRVAIAGVHPGTASITVTATDTAGLAATQSFDAVVELPSGDRGVLFAFYEATGGKRWTNSDNWRTKTPLGEWYGIETNDQDRVDVLRMGANNLDGEIPPDIGRLSELKRFSIRTNSVTGPIPEEVGQLSNLTELHLTELDLTGSIPAELGQLAGLQSLDLGANSLSGPIPRQLGGLTRLWQLSLDRNRLEGEVPPELGRLTGLLLLHLVDNAELRGELPEEMTALRSLREFHAGGTDLCAPATAAFTDWLDGIVKHRVKRCGDPENAYLTQAVQSFPYPVPLVAGDSALLRVFVTATKAGSAKIPPVKATFHDATGAEVLVVDIPGLDRVIPTEVDEGNLETSSNAVIPGSVVEPGLQLVIEVDPDDELDPDLGVPKRIPADGRLKLDVIEMPTLDLTVIPMLWQDEPDSAILEITDSLEAEDALLWGLRDLLPVGDMRLTVHDPVMTSENRAGGLLAHVQRIRAMEGGAGHYIGMMMEASLAGDLIGLAELPGRASFSIPDALVVDHELGHNFSLLHANRCGAEAGDRGYPSAEGDIGAWGYDFRAGGLVDPREPDLMTFCEPHWVGDYHFTNALNYRVHDEGPAAGAKSPVQVLLLSGGVDARGVPFLDPAFVMEAAPSLPGTAGGHRITGRTPEGGELFSLRFEMPAIADGDGSSSFAFAIPVRDGWARTLAAITLSGGGRSHTVDRNTGRAMAMLRDPDTGQVRQIVRELPPGPAGRDAAAALASGQGFELFFSRGIPEPEDWRRRRGG